MFDPSDIVGRISLVRFDEMKSETQKFNFYAHALKYMQAQHMST